MPVISGRKNRLEKIDYDTHLYKERHKIECLFGFLKHYRRLFSRFDKLKELFYRLSTCNPCTPMAKMKSQQNLYKSLNFTLGILDR